MPIPHTAIAKHAIADRSAPVFGLAIPLLPPSGRAAVDRPDLIEPVPTGINDGGRRWAMGFAAGLMAAAMRERPLP